MSIRMTFKVAVYLRPTVVVGAYFMAVHTYRQNSLKPSDMFHSVLQLIDAVAEPNLKVNEFFADPHPCGQFGLIEGFGYVIVGARVQADNYIVFLSFCGQHNNVSRVQRYFFSYLAAYIDDLWNRIGDRLSSGGARRGDVRRAIARARRESR